MSKKKSLIIVFISGILIFCGICIFVKFANDVSVLWEGLKDLKFYPERVSIRDATSEDFTLLWSKETGEGSKHLVYTQIFTPGDKSIIYITPNTMNSIDISTGAALWTTEIPEDSTFHFYNGEIFSLDSYDDKVPFAPEGGINIPSNCNSEDQSTLRVYNPYSGKKNWEYSYHMVYPYQIFFKDNSAYVDGLTDRVTAQSYFHHHTSPLDLKGRLESTLVDSPRLTCRLLSTRVDRLENK